MTDGSEGGDAAAPGPCAEIMVGRYAVRDTTFSRAVVLGDEQIVTTVNYNLVEITQTADGLLFETELCTAETLDDSGSPTAVPEQNLGYLANRASAPLTVDCATSTWRVDPERQYGGWAPGVPPGCEGGATMSTNWRGDCRCPKPGQEAEMPLPNDGDDCRVTDEDNDEEPGIAVSTSWMGIQGNMYVAFDREGFAQGTIDLTGEGKHTGRWNDRGSENTIFGCDKSATVFIFGCPMPDTRPCNAPVNEMIFEPVGAAADCDTVSLSRETLFQDYVYAGEPSLSMCTCIDCN